MSLRWDVLSTRGRCFHSLQIFYISTSLAVGVSFGPLPFLRAQQRSKKRSGEVASLGCFTDASTRNPTHSSDGRRSERFRHSECLKTDGFGRFMGSKTNRSPVKGAPFNETAACDCAPGLLRAMEALRHARPVIAAPFNQLDQ